MDPQTAVKVKELIFLSLSFRASHFKLLVHVKKFSFNFYAFLLISISLESYTSATNFYKELPNSDFPKLHDYGCLNSRLFGACQLAVYDVTEAKYKCDTDDQCKAFVTTAKTLWTGKWRQSTLWTSYAQACRALLGKFVQHG